MRENTVTHAAGGAVGGALGTMFLLRAMKASRRLPERLKPTMPRKDPGDFMVSKVEELSGRPLPQRAHDALAQAMHFGYGTTAGTLLGLLTTRRRLRTLGEAALAGSLLGTAIWAVGYAGWLPRAKLTPPVGMQGARHVAVSVAGHVAFGVVSALPLLLVDRALGRRRKPWYLRALGR